MVWWPAATGTALACSFHSLASLSNHVIGPDKWPGTPVLNKEHPREQAFYSFPNTGVLGISSQLPLPYHRTKRSKRPQMGHLFTSSPPFLRELWVFFPSDVRTISFTKEENNSHQRWPRHLPFDLSRQVRDLPLFLQLMETIHVHSANFSSSDLLSLISFRKLCKNRKRRGGEALPQNPGGIRKVEELKMLSLLTQTMAAGLLMLRTHSLTFHTLSPQLQDTGLSPLCWLYTEGSRSLERSSDLCPNHSYGCELYAPWQSQSCDSAACTVFPRLCQINLDLFKPLHSNLTYARFTFPSHTNSTSRKRQRHGQQQTKNTA